jgi:hypothetical protein
VISGDRAPKSRGTVLSAPARSVADTRSPVPPPSEDHQRLPGVVADDAFLQHCNNGKPTSCGHVAKVIASERGS